MTDCYIWVAEFRPAVDINRCTGCRTRLSGKYAIRDADTLDGFPECRLSCGD